MATIVTCTDISNVGSGTNGAKRITKVTGTTDELQLNTRKGNIFLTVGVADKNGTSVGTSHLNSTSTNPGKIPRFQTGVVVHVRLIQDLVE